MALSKLFQRIFWHNNTTPAINEDNLNSMSKAIDDIDDRVIELGGDVLETVPEILEAMDDMEDLSRNPPYIGTNGNWYVWNTDTGDYVDSGIDASITVTIADITMLAPSDDPYVTNTGTNTDPIFHLFIPRGKGISSVAKTGTSGLVDTYTITYTDGYTTTFTVTNGKTAYQSAVEGGYTGTEEQFESDLRNFHTYRDDAIQAKTDAISAKNDAVSAKTDAVSAKNDAVSAKNDAISAKDDAVNAKNTATSQATLAQSYAKGGTNTRTGEDTDNAKYYKEQASTSATNAAGSASTASTKATEASNSASTASTKATEAANSATSASGSATTATQKASAASTSATNAGNSATTATNKATLAESWAVGGTNTRTGEDTNNAKYWAEQAASAASGGNQIYHGACSTAAATQIKEVTGIPSTLKNGDVITVNFQNSNSFNCSDTNGYVTFKINNVQYTICSAITPAGVITKPTGTNTAYYGEAARINAYKVDVTNTRLLWLSHSVDWNTTYSPQSLGFGKGTCGTAEATAAKEVTLSGYALITNGIVSVKFTYAVPANATLNINGKGAKAIYYRGAAITAGIIKAGDTVTFVYNGTQYDVLSFDRDNNTTTGTSYNAGSCPDNTTFATNGSVARTYTGLNNSLSGKVSGFASGNYAAVTGLAYDSTNSQLGLKVGADTIIPFKKGISASNIDVRFKSTSGTASVNYTHTETFNLTKGKQYLLEIISASSTDGRTLTNTITLSGGTSSTDTNEITNQLNKGTRGYSKEYVAIIAPSSDYTLTVTSKGSVYLNYADLHTYFTLVEF